METVLCAVTAATLALGLVLDLDGSQYMSRIQSSRVSTGDLPPTLHVQMYMYIITHAYTHLQYCHVYTYMYMYIYIQCIVCCLESQIILKVPGFSRDCSYCMYMYNVCTMYMHTSTLYPVSEYPCTLYSKVRNSDSLGDTRSHVAGANTTIVYSI